MLAVLSRERIVAAPGFNRWLIPPCALAIHLCIGQAYAFSVFKLPLTRVLGVTAPSAADWTQPQLAWVFTIAIVALGLSAALFGKWVERAGPRRSGVTAAALWSAGFVVSALGVHLHAIALLYLGYGVIGGCGLGIGYITPVSTLIKWFPDRRGLATGMAIMGFGGGAFVAGPLSQRLMERFAGPDDVGVAPTLLVLGGVYFVVMMVGALGFRLPPGGHATGAATGAMPAGGGHHVSPSRAIRTPQFYLLWGVLCLNVTAGIGVIEQASPMIQELFAGRIDPAAAAGFVGLLSLFNMGGRFVWSSLSDRIGRKRTYACFFTLGPALYLALPWTGEHGSVIGFVVAAAAILTMYGGGFATIPAYLADLFGTQFVGAIHGRLLTAWSAAGVAGPWLVNHLRQSQIDAGVAPTRAYTVVLQLMAALLVLGFVLNALVRDVASRHHMSAGELEHERRTRGADLPRAASTRDRTDAASWWVIAAWLAAGAPLTWGIVQTARGVAAMFR